MTQTTVYSFKKRILSVFITILVVSSCASPDKKPKIIQPITTEEVVLEVEEGVTAKDYLQDAKKASSQDAIALMLKAALTYNHEKNYIKSLWLAGELIKLPLSHSQLFSTSLIRAESLFALDKNKEAEAQLSLANNFIADEEATPDHQYYVVTAISEKKKNNNVRANNAALLAFSLNTHANDSDVMTLWNELSALSSWELQQLKSLKPPYFEGWLDLILAANKWGDNKVVFDQKIAEFQFKYYNHPAKFITEQLLLVSQADTANINNIAILLPLSGQHKSIGEIVQQGILAGYNDQTLLTFIDTNELDFTTLALRFKDEEVDHVIGPLLKPNVDAYIAQSDIQQPTLLLNIPTLGNLSANHFAFSMRREDEAIQAATVLVNKNYKHPVLFSTQDNASQKIASSFASKWQQLTGDLLETIQLPPNQEMQKALKTSLDIDVSTARIRNLEAQISEKIKTENRNRRDIDMIFIAAPSQYTRLIKPFIDVNTSTFSNSIPMYASSLSHKGATEDSEIRDLSGLTFSEIPWLLESESQNKVQQAISHDLWPNRPESLQRIFALGYDSLQIMPKLELMKELPYLRHYGQTGELNMDKDNIISRSILWGQYNNGTVKEVDME
ncbi:penicillin-binding protein activator [Pseudocolwellia sp. HL-MZ19]|uniref:penicillin-binding protein activator n=1 Tax=unclassified Pseudocolwellia TaxID=2848178 RepID=UPI003CEE1490